jgi:hypothetical protein
MRPGGKSRILSAIFGGSLVAMRLSTSCYKIATGGLRCCQLLIDCQVRIADF